MEKVLSLRGMGRTMAVITKAERRLARDEALANTRIEGHVPTPEFLADFDSVVDGRMTPEQAIEASLARATDHGIAECDHLSAQGAAGMNTGEDGQ